MSSQVGGAVLAFVGVAVTTVGLHGIKHEMAAHPRREWLCKRRSYAAAAVWVAGQVAQLLSVNLATASVVAAVTNCGIWVNALLAHFFTAEALTWVDGAATFALTLGAVLVVVAAPPLLCDSMSAPEVAALFRTTPIPAAARAGSRENPSTMRL